MHLALCAHIAYAQRDCAICHYAALQKLYLRGLRMAADHEDTLHFRLADRQRYLSFNQRLC